MTTKPFNITVSGCPGPFIRVSHAPIAETYLDPTQPPTKKVPFRQVRDLSLVKSIHLCLPTCIYNDLYVANGKNQKSSKSAAKATTSVPRITGSEPTTSMVSPIPQLNIKNSKVILTLHDILSNHELRTRYHIMLAQPYPPSSSNTPSSPSSNSTVISLNQGILTIELSYSTSLRAGLSAAFRAKEVSGGGRKHEKQSSRYRYVINLRLPGMVRGRAGFDRLMRASREVEGLKEARLWLASSVECGFNVGKSEAGSQSQKRKRNCGSKNGDAADSMGTADQSEATEPQEITSNAHVPAKELQDQIYVEFLSKHHATTVTSSVRTTIFNRILVPEMLSDASFLSTLPNRISQSRTDAKGSLPDVLEEDIHDLIEYIGLLFLCSPRITAGGYQKIDPYLCRYTLPDVSTFAKSAIGETQIQGGEPTSSKNVSNASDGHEEDETKGFEVNTGIDDLTLIEVSGLMSSNTVLQLVVDLIRRSRSSADQKSNPINGNGCWAALQVKTHANEVQGETDGLVILLQSGSGSGYDVDRQSETTATATDGILDDQIDMDVDERESVTGFKKEKVTSRGFKYATCFEFVDAIVD